LDLFGNHPPTLHKLFWPIRAFPPIPLHFLIKFPQNLNIPNSYLSHMSTDQVSVETVEMESETSLKRPHSDVAEGSPEGPEPKRTCTENPKESKRKTNWDLDDTLAFLLLLQRFNMNFGQVLLSLKNDQHRRPDETEVTLGKYWKNLKSSASKFSKPFSFPAFKAPPQKHGAPRLKGKELEDRNRELELQHSIKRTEAEKIYLRCKELIEQMREKEILLKSGDVIDEETISDAKKARENIRANRLLRYEEMAKKDEQFQEVSLETMRELAGSLKTTQEATSELLLLLGRLVAVEEAKLTK